MKSIMKAFQKEKESLSQEALQHEKNRLIEAYIKAVDTNHTLDQINYLLQLAELHLQIEQETKELFLPKKCYAIAAELAITAFAIYNEFIFNNQVDLQQVGTEREKIIQTCIKIETAFIKEYLEKTPSDRNHNTWMNYRNALNSLRQEINRRVTDPDHATHEILSYTTKMFTTLIKLMVEECIDVLGAPPTTYAFLGLGSMSREEMCPYSDVELVILIGNDNKKIREYFVKLLKLLELKLIFLGESPAKLFGLKGVSQLSRKGFRLDDTVMKCLPAIINTPEKLAAYQSYENLYAANNKYSFLCDPLKTTNYICGNENQVLHLAYEKTKEKILSSKTTTPDSKLLREIHALEMTEWAVSRQKPKLDQHKLETKCFDIKEELYRLPSLIIHCLAVYYGLSTKNTWDRLDELHKKNIINSEAITHLKQIMEQITRYRIKAHLYYGEENDEVYHQDIIANEKSAKFKKKLFQLEDSDIKNFLEIYKVILPLYRVAKDFQMKSGKTNPFEKDILYDERQIVRAMWCEALGQNKMAKEIYTEIVSINRNDLETLAALGRIQLKTGNYKEALKTFKETVQISKKIYGETHIEVAEYLFELSQVYFVLRKHRRVKESLEETLAIQKKIYDESHYRVIATKGFLGEIYAQAGEYKTAQKLLEQLLTTHEQYLIQADPEALHGIMTSLAIVYGKLDDHDRKKQLLEKELVLDEKGSIKNLSRAITLVNLGNAYGKLGKYQQKRILLEEALDIFKYFFDPDHPEVAEVLVNLGNVNADLKDYYQAIAFLQRALVIKEKCFGRNHPDIAIILNNLGTVYMNQGYIPEALEYLTEAYHISRNNLGDQAELTQICKNNIIDARIKQRPTHEQLAKILGMPVLKKSESSPIATLLGQAQRSMFETLEIMRFEQEKNSQLTEDSNDPEATDNNKTDIRMKVKSFADLQTLRQKYQDAWNASDYRQAVLFLEEILKIYEEALGKNHKDVALTLLELSFCYRDLENLAKAKMFQDQALNILKQGNSEIDKDSSISILTELGKNYAEQNQPEKAITLYNHALEFAEKLYGEEHQKIAYILTCLAVVLNVDLKQYAEAKKLLNRALVIYEKTNYEEHINMAGALANLGNVLIALKEFSEAKIALERALKIIEKKLGEKHPRTVYILVNLSQIELVNNDYKNALKNAADAYMIAKGYHGSEHPETLFAFKNLWECKAAFNENVQLSESEIATITDSFQSQFWSGQQADFRLTTPVTQLNDNSSAEPSHENTEETEEEIKSNNDTDYDQLMGHRS